MAPTPDFQAPAGAPASVKIIDTTSNISGVPFLHTMKPAVEGVEFVPDSPVWAFLVENSEGRRVLFDLGTRKDWKSLAPVVSDRLIRMGWDITVKQDITEILEQEGFGLDSFEAVIWSHWHWDHIGDPSLFPKNVSLVVGPGFKDTLMPGYPARQDSVLLETDYEGRKLVEIHFQGQEALEIGRMRAHDYFGDGSFYLLDAPGHTVGHLCGLVRTSAGPDTFMLLGADAVHDAGELRPSHLLPFPEDGVDLRRFLPAAVRNSICPCHVFSEFQEGRGREAGEPILESASGFDMGDVARTVEKLQHADADGDVFFIYAHDRSIMDVVDFFPKEANEWKARGWAGEVRWAFLKEYWGALNLDESKN